ncbi:DUF3577 domain-containing protein [Acidovorax sp. SUPP3334]|uniref:DUF3577 domain-containing protein n=1 Tax=Acidovorax sp. SUPP3334 TaxID=2920881 RepID=UPI0023DE5E5C|nr:DUF3577 domain-containing protein [Acidovorax sp. SUPP3334]GKT25132.1 DUF3577 domain-containing protein [Acidovorax sp. SUPP3334]
MTATTQGNDYFNLHTNGIGYLNRVRWVETKNGGRRADPFLACSISALRGNADKPDYTYFDLRVSGDEAIAMVERLGVDVQEQRKVVLSFRIGDIYPHLYERDELDQNRRKTGRKEMATLIKGRLLLINSITIDGENVYRREADAPQDDLQPGYDEPSQGEEADQEWNEPEQEPRQEQSAPAPTARPAERFAQQAVQQPNQRGPVNRPSAPSRQPQVARQPAARPQGNAAYNAGYATGKAVRRTVDSAAA